MKIVKNKRPYDEAVLVVSTDIRGRSTVKCTAERLINLLLEGEFRKVTIVLSDAYETRREQ